MVAALEFRPVTDFGMGAEVVGLDLRQPIAPETAAALRRAFDQYLFLLVRDQPITDVQQAAFARVFGELDQRTIKRFAKPGEEAHFVSNAQDGDRPKDGGGGLGLGEIDLHLDQMFFEKPNSACTLHGVEVPSRGGETIFALSELVYNELPTATKERLASLKALQFLDASYVGDVDGKRSFIRHTVEWPWTLKPEDIPAEAPRWVHPIVFNNPRNGRKAVWLCTLHTLLATGISRTESDDLLGMFFERLDNTPFRYFHPWKVGETIIWSNWAVHHGRTDFDAAEHRTLQRVPIGAPIS